MYVNFNILNQLGSPSLNSNTFANRPAAGQTGRLFISTDTFEIYRDNGTGWDLIGTGTGGGITGSGTANQVTYWTGTSAVGGESAFTYNPTTNALRVDGNISLNRNADAWTPNNVFTVGNGSFTSDVGGTYLTFNAYYNVDWKYSQNGVASFYAQANGGHIWYNASSGTAGNNCSLTIAMYLDDNENLGVNGAPSAWINTYKVVQLPFGAAFYSSNAAQRIGLVSNAYLSGSGSWLHTNSGTAQYYEMNAGQHTWYQANSGSAGTNVSWTARMILNVNGSLGLGTGLAAWASSNRVFQIGDRASIYNINSSETVRISGNGYFDGANTKYTVNAAFAMFELTSRNFNFYSAPNGTAGTNVSFTTHAQIVGTTGNMSINAGNLLIGTTTDSGNRIRINGSMRIDGQTAATAGGSAGLHLIVNCDGTNYKISLLNV